MFKQGISLVAIFILTMFSTIIAFAERTVEFDTSDIEKGIIRVLYENDEVSKAKLLIQRGSEKEYRDLSNSGRYEKFLLTSGEGKYIVAVYEHVSGTKYRRAYAENIDVKLEKVREEVKEERKVEVKEETKKEETKKEETKKEETKKEETKKEETKKEEKVTTVAKAEKVLEERKLETVINEVSKYLSSTKEINFENAPVALKLAKDLTKNANTNEEKAKIIHKYIVERISYDYQKIYRLSPGYMPNIDEILSDKKGICYDYAVVYAGMLRSVGVETKLIKGYATTTTAYHAWNEVLINGKWVIVDTTFDAYMEQNGHKYDFEKSTQHYHTVVKEA